jgi:hypothetical protein
MMSSGMLRRVALVRTEVLEDLSSSFTRLTRIGELGTTLSVTNNRRTLLVRANVVPSSPILVTRIKKVLVAASVVPSSPIFVILMKEELGTSETSVLTRATRHNNPEDTILRLMYMFVVKYYKVLIHDTEDLRCLKQRNLCK